MLAPLSWLKDFAEFPDDVSLLRSSLDELGLVVEDVTVTGDGLNDVIVARIDEISSIEGADRIRLVTIEAGGGPLEIVCGAMNFSVGDFVPFAPVGAVLPGDFVISLRKMKGVVSNGMLCSGKELGIGDDHDGLMLLTGTEGIAVGAKLIDVLGITRDVIFDITVEGNRPDAHSISGIARDLAAKLKLKFSDVNPSPPKPSGDSTAQLARAVIKDPELCSRLVVRVATKVRVTESPMWIQQRLEKSGMRPINNVVDASNYVMLEMGQPTHPYDLALVAGPGLIVRRAKPGESLTTLDGVKRTLGVGGKSLGDTGEDCVICDANDSVIGIAGIMGGSSSEISDETTAVLLEAASFDPIASTRTSRRLAHRTEASTRFQKGIDPANLERVAERYFELLALSSPEIVVAPDPLIIPSAPVVPTVLDVPLDRITKLLGVEFSSDEVAELLIPLGFNVIPNGSRNLTVTVPTNRPDIRSTHHGIADVVEEIARTYGYVNLPRRTSPWPEPGKPNERQTFRTELREIFLGLGANEAWTSSLVAPGQMALLGIDEPEIAVTNPLTQEESRLRRSLLPGLLSAVGYNADRRQADIVLFEMGAVFIHPDAAQEQRMVRAGAAGEGSTALPTEQELAMILMAGPEDDARSAVGSFAVIGPALRLEDVRIQQGDSVLLSGLHPTRSALLVDAWTNVVLGALGEVDPSLVASLAPSASNGRIGALILDLEVLRDPLRVIRSSKRASAVSRYPSADLDLAFSVPDGVSVDAVRDALRHGAGELLEETKLFDVYRGAGVEAGSRSLAFAVRLCAEDRTLSDDEISSVRESMIGAVTNLGASLR